MRLGSWLFKLKHVWKLDSFGKQFLPLPAMSGYASDAAGTFCVTVSMLSGDPVQVASTRDMVGKELWSLLAAEYASPGSQKMPRVLIGNKPLDNDAHLVKQGLKGGDALITVLFLKK